MKRGKISRAMDSLDEKYIAEAVGERKSIFKDKRVSSGIMAVAAVFLLAIGIFYFNRTPEDPAPGFDKTITTSVAIDVNPGIEILVDDRELVLELTAQNADAEAVISEIDVLGESLDTAVSAVIRKMVDKGYLSESKNSVLLSVDADGRDNEATIKNALSDKITALLSEKSISAAVITQSYDKQGEDSREISKAKAALIKKIIASGLMHKGGVAYTFDQLKVLNINELKLLLDSKKHSVEGTSSRGEASLSGLIDADSALEIALSESGLEKSRALELEVELDFEDGVMVYEIEFEFGENEYEYEINAENGEIIEKEIEKSEKD